MFFPYSLSQITYLLWENQISCLDSTQIANGEAQVVGY